MRLPLAPRPSGSRPVDVVAFGENSLDIVGRGAGTGVPAPGAKIDLDDLRTSPGGQAATAAATCARLGWKARYVGAFGTDTSAGEVERSLREAGVDVVAVRRPGVPNRTAFVFVDGTTGERTVYGRRPEALALQAAELPVGCLTSGRILIVDATDVAVSAAAAAEARDRGIPTIGDLDRPVPGARALLAVLDVIVVAESFFADSGVEPVEGVQRLAATYRPAMAVVTLGAEGALAVAGGREWRVRPPRVEVRDTTGAGDAFRGGLASAWLEWGAEATVERLLTFATVTATLACRKDGAQGGLPDRAEVAAFL